MSDFPLRSTEIGPFTVYAYGLALALGGLAAFLLLWLRGRGRGLRQGGATGLAALCLVLGLAFSRLFYALLQPQRVFFDTMQGEYLGLWPLFSLQQGGLSVYGLLIGLALAAWLWARLTRTAPGQALDLLAQPVALFLCVLRFSGLLGGAGYGAEVLDPAFQCFPFAVSNAYGEWYLAVFLLEGLLMFALLLTLQVTGRRPGRSGDQALLLLALFSAATIFTESLRQDNIPRLESNSFIRLNQVLGLLALIVVLIVLSRRLLRNSQAKQVAWLWLSLLIASAAAMAAEFNEKLPLSVPLLYALSFLSLMGLNFMILRSLKISRPGAAPARP